MSDGLQDPPYKSEAIDISATDHAIAIQASAIWCNAAGTVYAKLAGDGAFQKYVTTGSQFLVGRFVAVEKVGTTLTAAGDMLAVQSTLQA